MVKKIKKTIPIPDSVTVSYENNIFKATSSKGTNARFLWYPLIDIKLKENEVIIDTKSTRKEQKAMVGTYASHITNMIKGVDSGFKYQMKVVYSHFPMQLKVTKNQMSIGNFLGEKKPRIAKILDNVQVKINADEVIITGVDKELVSQTAANIEQKTKIKRFDPRVFQDGIYIVSKE